MKYAHVATVNYNGFPSILTAHRFKHIKQYKLLPFHQNIALKGYFMTLNVLSMDCHKWRSSIALEVLKRRF